MKKIFMVICLLFLIVPVVNAADQWYKGSTVPLAWDAVTTYEDGTPITEVMRYKVYIKNDKTGVQTEIANITTATITVTVPSRAWWRFGVQAFIDPDASAIAWSSDPVYCAAGQTFGLRWLFPAPTKGLRVSGAVSGAAPEK